MLMSLTGELMLTLRFYLSCHVVAGLQNDQQSCTLTPTLNLESPVGMRCMSVDCGRQPIQSVQTRHSWLARAFSLAGLNHCTLVL